jgi:hypothetical protein
MRFGRYAFQVILALLAGFLAITTACGGSSSGPSAPSPPVDSLPTASTTVQAESSNNTSAADSFVRQPNGNAPAGNVSKVPLRSLLYNGSNTKIYVTWLGWFGGTDHMNVGYTSDDPGQVHRQVEDMISRGVQGAIADWFGTAKTRTDHATMLLREEAEAHVGQFEFAIMEDVGALNSAAASNGCEVTDQVIADLTYIATQYESSPAYMRLNGRPVIFFFGVDAYYIDWDRVRSLAPGNPLLIFQGTNGFSREISDGGFSWVNINSSNPFDPNLVSQDSFYQDAQQTPVRLAVGTAYKGFNDTQAAWGTNRLINQQCGQAWQQTFSEAGKFYSDGNQLPAIQIATWNDYEEGTAIEPGIDNCIYLTPSQSGTTINWTIQGGDENTIDHYTVFISTDGTNLSKLIDLPRGTHSFDLKNLKLPPATYVVYIKATGAPTFQNKMSPPIAYHPGDQAPNISLSLTQIGSLTYAVLVSVTSGEVDHTTIDFGDGTVVSGASASHTYRTVGAFVITATAYDAAGASAVALQQISVKPSSPGVTILAPANGATVDWPTMLVASADPGSTVSVMRVLIDGHQAYAANGDILNTALKIFSGTHQISVESLDSGGNITASAELNVLAEPGNVPPVAKITLKSLPDISPTTVLGCTATSTDSDGFLISHRLTYSDGSQFSTPAALETFQAAGTYTATATVVDQFGSTNIKSTSFTLNGGQVMVMPSGTAQQPTPQTSEIP